VIRTSSPSLTIARYSLNFAFASATPTIFIVNLTISK
jgi:hypothetical protein